jgi:hypothetical protein
MFYQLDSVYLTDPSSRCCLMNVMKSIDNFDGMLSFGFDTKDRPEW